MKHDLGANTCPARGVILAVALALLPGCVRLPRPLQIQTGSQGSNDPAANVAKRLNINSATAEELERLPGVGPIMAARIIEHRQAFGPFRRAEHLIVVRGMSERRFRSISALVSAE